MKSHPLISVYYNYLNKTSKIICRFSYRESNFAWFLAEVFLNDLDYITCSTTISRLSSQPAATKSTKIK